MVAEIDPETGEILTARKDSTVPFETPGEKGGSVEEKVAAAVAQARGISSGDDERVDPESEDEDDDAAEAAAMAALEKAKAAKAAKAKKAAEAAAAAVEKPAQKVDAKPATSAAVPAMKTDSSVPAVASSLDALFEKDAGRGLAGITAETMIIPRLYLLQDNSPQVKEGIQAYVPGARPGMWFNTVTEKPIGAPHFLPVSFRLRYVGWRPRNDDGSGGGLVRMDVPREEFETYESTGIGIRSYHDEKGVVDVVETPEWAVLLVGEDGTSMAAAISFPKTKFKAAGKINTTVAMQEARRADGSTFTPPAYANVFRLTSRREGEGSNAYFVPVADYLGRLENADHFHRARRLNAQFEAGEIEVEAATAD